MIRRNEEGYMVRPPKGFGWMSGLTMDEIDAVRKRLGMNIIQIAAEINSGKLNETTIRK